MKRFRIKVQPEFVALGVVLLLLVVPFLRLDGSGRAPDRQAAPPTSHALVSATQLQQAIDACAGTAAELDFRSCATPEALKDTRMRVDVAHWGGGPNQAMITDVTKDSYTIVGQSDHDRPVVYTIDRDSEGRVSRTCEPRIHGCRGTF